jgi:general secretion pathway protein A
MSTTNGGPRAPWQTHFGFTRAPFGKSLDPSRHALIYIANPAFGTRGLYVSVVRAQGASPRFHKAEVMAQTSELLEAEEAERHRRVVIVVDEAHLLTPEQLPATLRVVE